MQGEQMFFITVYLNIFFSNTDYPDRVYMQRVVFPFSLKGVFAKNERGLRLTAKNNYF